MRYIKKHWLHILLLVALFTSLTIPALADMPVIQPASAGGLWQVDGTETQLITADEIDMQTKKIINLVDPAANQDAATKKYVDDAIDTDVTTHSGLDTGVHGAGGDTLATDADIATHAALDTGVHGAGGDTLATDADIDADIATHAADIDAHYAMTGATFPASPVDGMVFCHEVTGRKILYVYDAENTAWVAVEAIGTMTLYVDATDGSDSLEDHGTGVNGDAFQTVQYAVDCIPPIFSGDVTIYVNDEAYAETVDIRGKSPSGNYQIYIYGTLTELTSGTQSANGVQGTGATQGSFTDTGNLHATSYDNKLCYLDADGDYRIIDDATVDTATIAGVFTSQPLQNENYVIYDWGTTITAIRVWDSKASVVLYDLKLSNSGYVIYSRYGASLTCSRCCLLGISLVQNYGTLTIYDCYAAYSTSSAVFYVQFYGTLAYVNRTKICNSHTTGSCIYLNMGFSWLAYGVILDGDSGGADDANGVTLLNNAALRFADTVGGGYCRIRQCDTGIDASLGSMCLGTSTVQNTADTPENADAASFGYID